MAAQMTPLYTNPPVVYIIPLYEILKNKHKIWYICTYKDVNESAYSFLYKDMPLISFSQNRFAKSMSTEHRHSHSRRKNEYYILNAPAVWQLLVYKQTPHVAEICKHQ